MEAAIADLLILALMLFAIQVCTPIKSVYICVKYSQMFAIDCGQEACKNQWQADIVNGCHLKVQWGHHVVRERWADLYTDILP